MNIENTEELKKLLPPWDPDELMMLIEQASFTVRDMGVWCDVGTSTMRSWAVDRVSPHRVYRKPLRDKLDLLKRVLAEHPDWLPVPLIKRKERAPYIQKVLANALKLPKAGSTKRGV